MDIWFRIKRFSFLEEFNHFRAAVLKEGKKKEKKPHIQKYSGRTTDAIKGKQAKANED